MSSHPLFKIKIQFLAAEKEVLLNPLDTVDSLKSIIQSTYNIPVDQQALTLGDRNITTAHNTLSEIGIKDGSLVQVKRIHRSAGKMRSGGIESFVKNPMVKNMLKNPSTLKSIKEMFPGLKEEAEENSSLNMLMNSEAIEDELQRFAEDDEYMNTQLRNVDITMAKLENLPDGVRMMSSMARDTQNLGFVNQPGIELKAGSALKERNTKSIPGRNNRNYTVEYRKQLLHLKQIGFENVQENIEVLKSVGGDLQSAQEVLLRKYGNE